MAWPTPQEYNEAVQTPRIVFSDAELQAGAVEVNKLGLPRPITGQFACVYRLRSGQKSWAVRCFQQNVPDQHERYQAISDHLSRSGLPYVVGFQYQVQGIKVGKQWYPILKMEWVEGESLGAYVANHVQNSAALNALAAQWLDMLRSLRQTSIAHGDLQHGNVLVVQQQLKLVDYDGMFVPALRGRTGTELGHRNYQHPKRSGSDFGPETDNFSAWVIYLSLQALSAEPQLWQIAKGGDECLLFRRADFEQPDQSVVLQSLRQSRVENLRTLGVMFRQIIDQAPSDTPALHEQSYAVPTAARGTTGSSWLSDHVTLKPATTSGASQAPPQHKSVQLPDISWILDHIEVNDPIEPASFETPHHADRRLLARTLGFLGVMWLVLAGLGALNLVTIVVGLVGTAAVNLAVAYYRFFSDPAMLRSRHDHQILRETSAAISCVELELKRATDALNGADRSVAALVARIEANIKQNEASQKKEESAAQAKFAPTLNATAAKRLAVQQQEQRETQQTLGAAQAKQHQLQQQIARLVLAERQETADQLRVLQENHILSALRRHSISDAGLPGIGKVLTSSLQHAGYWTAADINAYVQSVPGIGQARATTIEMWRNRIETAARSSMPTTLPATHQTSITKKYQDQRQQLEREEQQTKQQILNTSSAIRARHQSAYTAIEQEERQAKDKVHEEVVQIRKRHAENDVNLRVSMAKAQTDHQAKREELEKRLKDVHSDLLQRKIEEKKQRMILQRTYKRLTFAAYLKRAYLSRS
jgi:hypothetical protein